MAAQVRHATVVGGSVAGLAAAAALAPRCEAVTVLERHELGAAGTIVRHGAFPHVLLGGGAAALERLVPGLTDDLVAHGALDPATRGRRCHWWAAGAVRRDIPDLGVTIPMCSRDLVEARLRHRVAALPNVELRSGVVVRGLRADAGRVVGLDLTVDEHPETVDADLVVDASGRGSRAPAWLESLGLAPPPSTEVVVDVTYTAIEVERRDDDLDGAAFAVVQNSAELARIGVALPAEGGRWKIVLGGYFGDAADPNHDAVLAFARSLPDAAIATLLENRWVREPARWRFRSSRRHHYERLRRLPAGLCVVGDAVASFNPLYGQGMSAAALQAECLGAALDRHDVGARLGRAVAKATAKVVANPWQIATGADFVYPQTIGKRPRGTALVNRYLEDVMRAAALDPDVNLALTRVQQLLAPPPSLMAPSTVRRVRRALRRRVRTADPASAPTAASRSVVERAAHG